MNERPAAAAVISRERPRHDACRAPIGAAAVAR